MITNGNVTIRAGSEDPIILQLLEDDGTTAINLTGITNLTLNLLNTATNVASTITGAKLVVSDASNGKITLSQVAADFPSAATYKYYISFTASSKARFVPEDKNYTLTVLGKFS